MGNLDYGTFTVIIAGGQKNPLLTKQAQHLPTGAWKEVYFRVIIIRVILIPIPVFVIGHFSKYTKIYTDQKCTGTVLILGICQFTKFKFHNLYKEGKSGIFKYK